MAGSLATLESKTEKAISMLKSRSQISNIMIGLSGGKDSLCLCELVKMAEIENVGYFNMEFLPNLRIQEDMLKYACERFNINNKDIERVPSEHFIKCMHFSAYTWYSKNASKQFPNTSRTDVFKMVARKHKATIVTGVKKVDSMQMQRMIDRNLGICMYPMVDWTLKDVLTFMQLRKIDIPSLTKKGCRGIGITPSEILFIYDNYYDDFLKIEAVFPFIRTIIYQYQYFDIKRNMRVI